MKKLIAALKLLSQVKYKINPKFQKSLDNKLKSMFKTKPNEKV